jgi:hypothetical protein
MSSNERFRPSYTQRRILGSVLHLITMESLRLRERGSNAAPVVTVSDVYTDLASDRSKAAPSAKAIGDELGKIEGVTQVAPFITVADSVWSTMGILPPPRVPLATPAAAEPTTPPPPPPPAAPEAPAAPAAHTLGPRFPRLEGETWPALLHRMLAAHPEGLTIKAMRILCGSDLSVVAKDEREAGRVAWERADGSGAITYRPRLVAPPEVAEQLDQVRGEGEPVITCGARTTYVGMPLECRLHINHTGSHLDEVKAIAWDDAGTVDVVFTPENADDVRPNVAPVADASPKTGPATAEGGDTSAVVEVAAPEEHVAPLRVYVATSLDHAHRAQAVQRELRARGHEITYDWTTHGSVQSQGDARMAEVAAAELQGVTEADVLVAILPGGRGTHIEIGVALGLGLPVVLLEQDGGYEAQCAFYRAPGVLRYKWNDEEVVGSLGAWAAITAETHWLQSIGPNAPRSIRDRHNEAVASWSRATSMLEDATIDLALARDTCINAGIPGDAIDAEGNTIPWGLPALVRRLAEQSAMHQDARSEAESAARTHLDEVEDLRKQLKASVQAELERSQRITELEQTADGLRATAQLARYILTYEVAPDLPVGAAANPLIKAALAAAEEEEWLVERVSELERDSDAAHALLNDTFGRSYKPQEGETALMGLARTAVQADVAVDARAAEQRAKLAAALGLSADPEWTWSHLLTEALALRTDRDELRQVRDAFRDFVAGVVEAIGIADHDRTEDPARTSVPVLDAIWARLRPDQEAEVAETAGLLREVEDRLRELVPGYHRPWTCVEAINALVGQVADTTIGDCRRDFVVLLGDALGVNVEHTDDTRALSELLDEARRRKPAARLIEEARMHLKAVYSSRMIHLDAAAELLGVS